jgi:alkylation response protein AidB-like acyl-CoA dehydrogenase
VGLAQACLDATLSYTSIRKQHGTYLKDHQLIQRMIAEMVTNIKAATLLCYHSGYLKDSGRPQSIMETSIAKYFASKTAYKAASDAVQIHGAKGCSSEYPVARYMRDAKIMEIIEGTNQIHQLIISRYAHQTKP